MATQRQSVANFGQALLQALAMLNQESARGKFQDLLTRSSTQVDPAMGDPATIPIAGGPPAQLSRFQGTRTVSKPTDYQSLIRGAAGDQNIMPLLQQYFQMQGLSQSLNPPPKFTTVGPGSAYGTTDRTGQFSSQGIVPTREPAPRSISQRETGRTKTENGIILKEMQDVDPITGQPVPGTSPRFVPWQQQSVASQIPPIVGAGKTGQALLSEIPENVRSVVKGIAEGTMRPEDALSFRGVGPYSKTYIMNLVGQYNPAYEGGWNRAVWKLQQDATTGRIGKIMSSMNMTVGHFKSYSDAANAIDNAAWQTGNTVKNWVKNNLGSPQVTALQTSMKAVTSELSGLLKAGIGTASPTDQEMEEFNKIIGLQSSPEQFEEFRSTALHLIASRMEALQHQSAPIRGHVPEGFTFISPKAKQILEEFGVDTERFDFIEQRNETRVVGGKTYVKINGEWYEQ